MEVKEAVVALVTLVMEVEAWLVMVVVVGEPSVMEVVEVMGDALKAKMVNVNVTMKTQNDKNVVAGQMTDEDETVDNAYQHLQNFLG